jgi:hypothetical protein
MPLLALVLLLGAALCWATVANDNDADSSELRQHLLSLQAHAAEAELLDSMSARPAASVFARVHAIQLVHRVEATRGDLDTLQHEPTLSRHVDRARALGARLADHVQALTMPPLARPIHVSAAATTSGPSLLNSIRQLQRELQP